jgi:hypothetical protein
MLKLPRFAATTKRITPAAEIVTEIGLISRNPNLSIIGPATKSWQIMIDQKNAEPKAAV